MNKKTLQKNRVSGNLKASRYITHPKLILFLLVLLMIPVVIFGYNKYKDWDNAQLIKGLHEDFPTLVRDIEQATGLQLEQTVNCSITTEKFNIGVRTCELSVAKATSQSNIDKSVSIMFNLEFFSESEYNKTSNAYRVLYDGRESCTLSGSDTIYISCITAVREVNIDLARELFINQ